MKILGVGCYASLARGYDTTSRAFKRWWHGRHPIQTATAMATCTSAVSTGTATGGTGATTGSTTTSTATTPLRCRQLSSLLTPLTAGLSFSELAIPTAEHPAYLLHFERQQAVLVGLKRFRFPEHHQKHLERIGLPYRKSHIGFLFLS
jgi:hypothetical protein